MKKILSVILVLVLLLSIIPFSNVTVSAATWNGSYAYNDTALNQVKSLMREQTSEYNLNRFDYILSEYPLSGYFNTKKTSGCTPHYSCGCGATAQNTCILSKTMTNFYDKETGKYVNLGSVGQCIAYGNYCLYRFFGKRITNGIVVSSSNKSSATNFKNYLESFNDLTGTQFYTGSHSFTYLAMDNTYIYFIDANSGGTYCSCGKGAVTNCKINLRRFTYSDFINKYSTITLYTEAKIGTSPSDFKLTIKYHANGGYIKSEKKNEIFIDGSGLMRKYSTNDYYANNWTYGTSYSNGLINASSFGVLRDGYKFAGWSLSKSGGTVYDQTTARKPEDIYPNLKNGSASITMYAVWEPYVLTIKYCHNGYIKEEKSGSYYLDTEGYIRKVSTNEYHTNSWKYGTTYQNGLIDNTTFGIALDGYKFFKWAFVKSDGTISYYDVTTSRKPEQIYPDLKKGNATITMIPYWKPNELKVICNANGGEVTSAKYYANNEDMIINRETSKLSTTNWYYGEKRENGFTDDTTFGLSKKCHEFVGWSLSKKGTKIYDKAESLAPETFYPNIKKGDTTVTVYAIWKETAHTYTNNCDTSCNVCGKTRAISHTYTTATTKATTSKNGSIVKKCTVCGKVASTTDIKQAKSFKLSTTAYTYNGKAKKPSVTVKDSAGKKLVKNKDYTVSYKNNTKVGKATVTIKLKGNYTGTKTLTFKINPKKAGVSKLTAAKKSLKVKITKQSSQVTGYEIQYSTSKKFTKSTTKTKKVTSYKTTSVTLKSLKAKKTYYVRVRTYKTVNGKKYYSGWSTYKSKKTK
ncbi:MAG: fibronectin type III domain-containing protein [Clostridia bacterium]|nr:fibronectin type III domain-containing protein [Clostridia bacterium]